MHCLARDLEGHFFIRGGISCNHEMLLLRQRTNLDNDVTPHFLLQFAQVIVFCKPNLFFDRQSAFSRVVVSLLVTNSVRVWQFRLQLVLWCSSWVTLYFLVLLLDCSFQFAVLHLQFSVWLDLTADQILLYFWVGVLNETLQVFPSGIRVAFPLNFQLNILSISYFMDTMPCDSVDSVVLTTAFFGGLFRFRLSGDLLEVQVLHITSKSLRVRDFPSRFSSILRFTLLLTSSLCLVSGFSNYFSFFGFRIG